MDESKKTSGTFFLEILCLQLVSKVFFSNGRPFSHSMSEQFWKQNTIISHILFQATSWGQMEAMVTMLTAD